MLVANTGQSAGRRREDGGRGLDNVRERLRLIYGDAATFSLRETHGTVEARLALPMEPA